MSLLGGSLSLELGRKQPPDFQQLQLLDDVDRRHEHATTRVDLDEAFELEALQRLADRRPATAELLAELVLGDHRTRPQLAGDDHFLDRAIGGLGQGFTWCRRRPAVQFQHQIRPIHAEIPTSKLQQDSR